MKTCISRVLQFFISLLWRTVSQYVCKHCPEQENCRCMRRNVKSRK